ncbi:MAG TPA: VWA domain-containing protein [Methanothrix sp.]|jgi:Ca-activated chloride channel family protein|uniref:vWA domain-containing protein n=1 Tax=Methanothrix soehngenii TaxID=2223 RepID=UPI000A835B71|nr:VWA domain-containing protein [Methanothrix soehngenii]HOI69720.1 VWA domain-containing protein [Methanothrix sp.]HPY93390.1 VWA domain-containing protein [Methanothrix soehngenii]
MLNDADKKVIWKILGATVGVFVLVYMVIAPPSEVTLESIIEEINVNTVPHEPMPVDIIPENLNKTLPDIDDSYPPQVRETTSSYIEIFSSTEKAGSGTDGWLTEAAGDFNDARIEIDGKQISLRLRAIPSGEAADYIISGKYRPDAYTPSNELWGEIIISQGVKAELVEERLVGNVAGILLTKAKKDELVNKYGEINTKTIVDAVANDELDMGYTNPFASSTGLNFLISALYAFDSSDLLSDKAVAGFESFQPNIPVVPYTTLQMREAAKSGLLDGFVLEYQTYMNTPEIRYYEFTPFGFRHDNPMYAIGELSGEKRRILNEFLQFTQQEKYQNLATEYGFNGLDEYKSEVEPVGGDVVIQAQRLWKDVKNAKPICAIFVVDISGSMDGKPLNSLKRSLLEGQKYIGGNNLVGLVSYSDDVNIDLPVAEFNLDHRTLFAGAVYDMQAGGGTATFDAIAVAMQMLIEQKAAGPDKDPNLKPRIFVLSDGETNKGHSLKDIRKILEEHGVPVYTIGYNADIPALEEISNITEGACINADTEDVVYKLRNLFNAEL